MAGNAKFAYYLRIVHVEGAGEIAVYLAGAFDVDYAQMLPAQLRGADPPEILHVLRQTPSVG